MSNKMFIDASHPEETRVVVVRGNKIEEFDFESEHKKQLKGNVYLARVTRVEPSLQAAFVEYGGNRHGFLAFSEIHPDYYQIPEADRQALIEAEARDAQDDDDEDEQLNDAKSSSEDHQNGKSDDSDHDLNDDDDEEVITEAGAAAQDESSSEGLDDDEVTKPAIAAATNTAVVSKAVTNTNTDNNYDTDHDEDQVESVGAEDALEELPSNTRPHRRHYKIQEVIKRRQILLVQVVKEERGNKGAALTTYLSLAGRYSVLMPNTARGGGISRKITNIQDRKRLKDIVKELEVPKGMGVILRTAGANRTKAEIRRDYEYLMRMWDNVRNLTMQSSAPALVYEEGNLIKRSIRDLYNKDITDLVVAGEAGYREAKEFMRMLMPSHAKVVQPYRDSTPIFARNGIEAQLDRMLHPQVTLKSGGYIIINQTEALVAIDVNSGRSTRESSIEETALQTNLEAAEEVARQLRLRDLAGLVVVDFIDMEEKRNNRAVEKRMKDCLKDDRARIQVGRISHFGLLEMSRQRIRASVLESTMQPCPHCAGTGYVRSASSMALFVIRSIEEYLQRHSQNNIVVRTPASTALYVLNQKRQLLAEMEARFGLLIEIQIDESVATQHLAIDKGAPATGPVAPLAQTVSFFPTDDIDIIEDEDDETEAEIVSEDTETVSSDDQDNDENGRKRRRRRRRRNGRDSSETSGDDQNDFDNDSDDDASENDASSADSSEDDRRKKRRRGRRGGRKNRRNDYEQHNQTKSVPAAEPVGFTLAEATQRLAAIAEREAKALIKTVVPAPEFVGYQPAIVETTTATAAAENAASQENTTTPATESEPAKKPARKRPVRTRASAKSAAKTAPVETAEETEVEAEVIAQPVQVIAQAQADEQVTSAPIADSTTETSAEQAITVVETATDVDTASVEALPQEAVIEAAAEKKKPASRARKPAATKVATDKATAEKPARAPRKPRAKKVAEPEAEAIAEVTETEVVIDVKTTAAPEPEVTAPVTPAVTVAPELPVEESEAVAKTVPSNRNRSSKPVVTSNVNQPESVDVTEDQPKRGGWWQKKGFF